MIVDVVIPALNEEAAIGKVIAEIPKELVREVIVVDNGSIDATVQRAMEAGATVLHQPAKGYGNACLLGLARIHDKTQKPDVVVFLDGDHSDYPQEMVQVLQPIVDGKADMVIGSRVLGRRERGSLTPQQRFGNWLSTVLIRWMYGVHYTDLGPFRAVKYTSLLQLNMQDKNYGWTVEMQVKAAKAGLVSVEVPVNYRNRIGVSKVSGTVKGTIGAGYKILTTIFKYS